MGFFVLQPNGDYLTTNSDFGTLSGSAGIFTQTDAGGTQNVYLPDGLLNFTQDTHGNRHHAGLQRPEPGRQHDLLQPGGFRRAQRATHADLQHAGPRVPGGHRRHRQHLDYAYDAAGHLLSVTAPGNLTTTYTYDTGSNAETANALLSITNPDGSQQELHLRPGHGPAHRHQPERRQPSLVTYTYPGEAEVRPPTPPMTKRSSGTTISACRLGSRTRKAAISTIPSTTTTAT